MLAPEVWKFKTPNQYSEINIGDFSNYNGNSLKNLTYSHSFNKMISVAAGNRAEIPKDVIELLANSDSYIINEITISEFIAKQFIELFIKTGEFYCISYDTNIDTEECVAITPLGQLILILNKETYQSLGMEGNLSNFSNISKDRYVVKINLYKPEENINYKRLRTILSSNILPKFKIHFTWQPNNINVCASSVAKYFSDLDYNIELYKPNSRRFTYQNIQLFNVNSTLQKNNIRKENLIKNFIEWIGMLTLECSTTKQPNSYLNSYINDENKIYADSGCLAIAMWKGIFSCKNVYQSVVELSNWLKSNPDIPWISIYVHGFKYSPVSFNLNEHNFITNGNNSYSIILVQNNTKYIFYKHLASNKHLKNKSK